MVVFKKYRFINKYIAVQGEKDKPGNCTPRTGLSLEELKRMAARIKRRKGKGTPSPLAGPKQTTASKIPTGKSGQTAGFRATSSADILHEKLQGAKQRRDIETGKTIPSMPPADQIKVECAAPARNTPPSVRQLEPGSAIFRKTPSGAPMAESAMPSVKKGRWWNAPEEPISLEERVRKYVHVLNSPAYPESRDAIDALVELSKSDAKVIAMLLVAIKEAGEVRHSIIADNFGGKAPSLDDIITLGESTGRELKKAEYIIFHIAQCLAKIGDTAAFPILKELAFNNYDIEDCKNGPKKAIGEILSDKLASPLSIDIWFKECVEQIGTKRALDVLDIAYQFADNKEARSKADRAIEAIEDRVIAMHRMKGNAGKG